MSRLTHALFLFSAVVAAQRDAQAALRHRYSFSEFMGPTISNVTMVTDSVGGAHGTVRGENGMLTGSQIVLPGGNQSGFGAYVDLPNGMISSITTDATFEAWYTINVPSSWARIWSFGDAMIETNPPMPGVFDYEIHDAGPYPGWTRDRTAFYFASNRGTTGSGVNINGQQAQIFDDQCVSLQTCASGIRVNPNAMQSIGTQQHVAVTVKKDANGAAAGDWPEITVFHNGVQVGSAVGSESTANLQLENLHDVNNWLGRSGNPFDTMFNGSINEFRIYDHLLTPSDAQANAILGPDIMGDVLSLEVHLTTGNVVMKNTLGVGFPAFDHYRISSPSGALISAGWNSFDDSENGDAVGIGWDESGGADAHEVSEFFLQGGDTTFAANSWRSLGNLFNTSFSFQPDLVFELGTPDGKVAFGDVAYIGDPFFGDYNEDGAINAADYTVYRNRKAGIGGTTLPNEAVTPGEVTIDDYYFWKAAYFGSYGGGGSAGFATVPEPAALVLLLCGLLLTIGAIRRPLPAIGRFTDAGRVW